MTDNKLQNWKKSERFFLATILSSIILQGYLNNDSIIAIFSAICGITYTFIAGKGHPICYFFGVIGSTFYCILAYQNSL